MTVSTHDPDHLADAVYYALFKVVSVAELSGPERAVEWAESALEDEQLLRSFAARTRQRLDADAARRPR